MNSEEFSIYCEWAIEQNLVDFFRFSSTKCHYEFVTCIATIDGKGAKAAPVLTLRKLIRAGSGSITNAAAKRLVATSSVTRLRF